MSKNYFAGIDVGTSYIKAVIIDEKNEIAGFSTERTSADLKKSIKNTFEVAISAANISRNEIKHITRDSLKDAKAGNINNALRFATGEFCFILDPDHVPHPKLLDKIIPQFDNTDIGFVQIVQGYYNNENSFIATINAAREKLRITFSYVKRD